MNLSDIADVLGVISFFLSLYAVKEVISIKKTHVQSNVGQGNVNAGGDYIGRDRNSGVKPSNE